MPTFSVFSRQSHLREFREENSGGESDQNPEDEKTDYKAHWRRWPILLLFSLFRKWSKYLRSSSRINLRKSLHLVMKLLWDLSKLNLGLSKCSICCFTGSFCRVLSRITDRRNVDVDHKPSCSCRLHFSCHAFFK